MSIEETIKDQIKSNSILLYMKGSPEQPQCGFSAQAVQCLMGCGQRFAYVDVLANPDVRSTLPKVGDWPTFPQLWLNGELVGGCDIINDLYEKGDLQKMVGEAGEAEQPSAG